MSAPEDEEYEVEVGRPVMPGEDLRPFVSLELYAPPLPSLQSSAVRVASRGTEFPATMKVIAMATPLVSGKLAAVAGVLATALGAAASWAPSLTFLPSWAPVALWCLAGLAAVLAGLPLPEFKGGAPVAQKAVVALGAVSAGLGTAATSLPPGVAQTLLGFAALVALALTGKAIPMKPQEDVSAPAS